MAKTPMYTIVNTIINEAGLSANLPVATIDNIEAIRSPLTDPQNTPLMNKFCSTLFNKIAVTKISKMIAFENPFTILKGEPVDLGTDIEEIHVSLAKANPFDGTGSNLLNRSLPDVKVLFHRMNREDQYKVTVSRTILKQAFMSWDKFETFLSSIIQSIYMADKIDEYTYTKHLLSRAFYHSDMVLVKCDPVVTSTIGGKTYSAVAGAEKSLLKEIRKASTLMTFPSDKWNVYGAKFPNDPVPVIQATPKADQVLIIRADLLVEIEVEVLAGIFNLEKTAIDSQIITVEDFGYGGENVLAILADKDFLRIHDNEIVASEFTNAQGLYTNYMLTHFQTLSYSIFRNAVCFCFDIDNAVTPVPSTPSGAVAIGTGISLTSATDGAKIFYTLDGSEPTPRGTEYTTPIVVTAPVTIKAVAVAPEHNDSAIMTATYTISGT